MSVTYAVCTNSWVVNAVDVTESDLVRVVSVSHRGRSTLPTNRNYANHVQKIKECEQRWKCFGDNHTSRSNNPDRCVPTLRPNCGTISGKTFFTDVGVL